jgi:hypothetical protein
MILDYCDSRDSVAGSKAEVCLRRQFGSEVAMGTKATGTLARPRMLLLKGSYFFFLPPFFFPPFFLVAIVLFSLFHFHGMCGLSKKPQLMNV